MAKRCIALLIALCLAVSLMPLQALAADTLTPKEVTDTVIDIGFTVTDLYGEEKAFDYTVPSGGAAVLIFFSAGCGNCADLFYDLDRCSWLDDPNVNIVAVEADRCEREALRTFIDNNAPGSERYIDYRYAESTEIAFRYFMKVSNSNTLYWPLVLVVTESRNEKTIRYAGTAVTQSDMIRASLDQLEADGLIGDDMDNGDDSQTDGANGALSWVMAQNGGGTTPAVSNNENGHNYGWNWADPIGSVLAYEQGGYVRAERIEDAVIVERYDNAFKLLSRREIPLELPLFGGIYIGEDYNFIVVGQTNWEESDETEVIRVVRYSKDWQRQAAASLCGANTVVPFDAGSLRFGRAGDMLYIRTSHEMYTSRDGLNHQANLMMSVKISDMTVRDCFSHVANIGTGYVSHSFNQFIRIDGTDLMYVDHGDAYPRSVVLIRDRGPAGDLYLRGSVSNVDVLPIEGDIGENWTGVEVGGFEYSTTHYLVAGISVDQTDGMRDYSYEEPLNVFITATPKNNFAEEATVFIPVTDYAKDSGVVISNPHLVKIGDDAFVLLWTIGEDLYFCKLDGTGSRVTKIASAAGRLSDCDPIVVDGKVVWYVTGDEGYASVPVFYELDPDMIDEQPENVPPVHTHAYVPVVTEPSCTEGGYTTYTCTCGENYVSDETSALGHDWDDGTVLREPTLQGPGLMVYRCNRCHLSRDEPIAYVPADGVTRISGSNRCETAFAVANMLKAELGVERFQSIIIANGDDFADALAGSYLANALSAPILLHRNSYIDENVEYVRQNLASEGTVYILGGTAAVPETLEDAMMEIDMRFSIHRLAGSNRFVTNVQILEETGYTGGEILVCNSHNFADALSASATGKPILLVNNTTGRLNGSQTSLLQSANGVSFTIIGGPAAVSESLEYTLSTYGPVTRVYGSNREATSVEVARQYFNAPDKILLAYSRNFPDGLCGGPLAYAMGAPLLLTNARAEAVAAEYVRAYGISEGLILGGTSAVSDTTARTVFGLSSDTFIPVQ